MFSLLPLVLCTFTTTTAAPAPVPALRQLLHRRELEGKGDSDSGPREVGEKCEEKQDTFDCVSGAACVDKHCVIPDETEQLCFSPLPPDDFPNPFKVHEGLAFWLSAISIESGTETPIVVRGAHATAQCDYNCVSYLDGTALNVFTEQRPPVASPPNLWNSWARAMCIAQCYYTINGDAPILDPLFEQWGFVPRPLDYVLFAALQTAQQQPPDPANFLPLQAYLVENTYSPLVYGMIVGLEIAVYAASDGWNAGGAATWDWDSNSVVACTGNCKNYDDITGYFAQNHPGPRPGVDKYTVEGTDKKWQPLQETDDQGYFSRQEHVTPHIGFTAKPILLQADRSDFKNVADPAYDYRAEGLNVVEELRLTGLSVERQQAVAFFDNKLYVRGLIEGAMRAQFFDTLTFEEHMSFIHGLSSGEYDAVLQSWYNKRQWDLVRPLTVIQRWGSDLLETYNGQGGVGQISARDLAVFVRTMPHSEYPSGSACICKAYAEFIDAWSTARDGSLVSGFTTGPEGFNANCDNTLPMSTQVGCGPGPYITAASMDEVYALCANSRVWGGMHFSASISAAEEACTGLGTMGFDFATRLNAGSTWGSSTKAGDTSRPICAVPFA